MSKSWKECWAISLLCIVMGIVLLCFGKSSDTAGTAGYLFGAGILFPIWKWYWQNN